MDYIQLSLCFIHVQIVVVQFPTGGSTNKIDCFSMYFAVGDGDGEVLEVALHSQYATYNKYSPIEAKKTDMGTNPRWPSG